MENIASIVAVLGVWFALMAVLALCVEAVIAGLKLPLTGLRGTASPDDVLNEVSVWLPKDETDAHQARIKALNSALEAIKATVLPATTSQEDFPSEVNKAVGKYVKSEANRRAYIRLLAVVFGIGFAFLFRIDTVQILSPLIDFKSTFSIWKEALTSESTFVVGVILSGVAASAGSSFWHDKSAQLRLLKTASEEIKKVTK